MSEAREAGGAPVSVYVHVPFCVAKCGYCDFFSLLGREEDAEPFARALRAAASWWVERGLGTAPVSLYVGGGTPTMLSEVLPALVRELRETLCVSGGAEITVEANPDSLTGPLARALAETGVTRISLGVQSLDDAVLCTLGRAHDAPQTVEAAGHVTSAGIELAVDLMCGVPGQSAASWADTLERAIALGPAHASVYPLSLEEGTPLAAAVSLGTAAGPDPDLAADMMLAAEDALGSGGLLRYEVASYAVPGRESVHNTGYWTGRAYIGVGPGAHGMLPTSEAVSAGIPVPAKASRTRLAVPPDLDRFLVRSAEAPVVTETLNAAEAAREDAMLGLRLAAGIDDGLAECVGVGAALRSLAADALVEHVGGRWRTTQRGWLLGNEVFGRVWSGE